MLFILSALFVGWALYWSIYKKDVPRWFHELYYRERNYDDKNNRSPATQIVHGGLIILLCAASWFFVRPFVESSGTTLGVAFMLAIGLIFAVLTNFTQRYAYYHINVKRKDAEVAIRKAHDIKDWATREQVQQALPHAGNEGVPVGIHIGEGVHWYDKGHMLTVGGTGQGKGVNLILPALLSNGLVAGGISVVCLDPKGENAAVAAPHLIAAGYDVHVLNPLGIPEIADLGNSRFNPFDQIDPASNDASKLYDVLAMALHNRKGTGGDSFFDNRCRQYLSLYMAYAHHTGQGNFETVYKWATWSGDKRKELLANMATDETFEEANTAEAISDRLTGEAAKMEESIYATIEDAINILKNKSLRASLAASDFDMRTVAKKPTAIFICVPFEDLPAYAPWVRMVFSFLLRTLTKHYDVRRKILVLLDEFPQLSYMDEIPRSSAVLRGYNVTLWPVVQNLGQLKTIYGENYEIFISSAIIKHWLSAGTDNTTADYISHRMPQSLKFIGSNPDGSPKEKEIKLLDPNQVMGFSKMICEISGLASPVRFDKVPYWDLAFSKDNAALNPFYQKA